MNFTCKNISSLLKADIIGNGDVLISKVSELEDALEGDITFLSNSKYEKYLYSTKASAVVIHKDFKIKKKITPVLILVDDPYVSFIKILKLFDKSQIIYNEISPNCKISKKSLLPENIFISDFTIIKDNVTIQDNCRIYSNVYIGNNVSIGENTIIYSGVKIYDNSKIGNNCIIHSNSVIGSDGFGFINDTKSGNYIKIPHIGNVIIHDNVEIGACCSLDRATIGATIINKGVKLDNQIHIAHNVIIGENTVIAAQSGIAGSTIIGQNCIIGGQVGIAGHLLIGDNVKIQAKSGVNSNIESNEEIYGYPAIGSNDYRRSYIIFKRLPTIIKKINKLENIIKNIINNV